MDAFEISENGDEYTFDMNDPNTSLTPIRLFQGDSSSKKILGSKRKGSDKRRKMTEPKRLNFDNEPETSMIAPPITSGAKLLTSKLDESPKKKRITFKDLEDSCINANVPNKKMRK